ncbi:ribonucleoprotein [Apiospora marii]|uniref:ribonucleoprotein n=1 Tax=Apiospora marii TaxID=335849 RepID=UPI00312F96D4
MAQRYVAGRPGNENDVDTTQAGEGTAAVSTLPDELTTPLLDDGPEAEDQEPSKIDNGSSETGSGTPAKSPTKTNVAPGHKPTLSTISGSTVVALHDAEKVDADEQGHEQVHDTVSMSPGGGPTGSELDPVAEEDLHEHTEQRQPQQRGPRKHHCPTQEAIAEGRRIYIGNLKFTLDHNNIVALLEKVRWYKPDCCCIYVPPPSRSKNPKTKPDHRNRGYCFVTYEDSCSAHAAMQKINHLEYEGRKLVSRYCLPKGMTYSEFLEHQRLIQQGGIPSGEGNCTGKPGSPSSGSSEQIPKKPRAPPYFYPHPYYDGQYPAVGFIPHPSQCFYWYSMGMTEYNPLLYPYAPPAIDPRAAPLDTPAESQGTVPGEVDMAKGSEGGNGNGSGDGDGDGVLDNNRDDIYRPPNNSTQADGRTIEVLNLPVITGASRDFKTYIQSMLMNMDLKVTGVSEPIYQYSPERPSSPVIEVSGGTFTATYHGCPRFYCYVQLGSKEDAEKASKVFQGMEIKPGGNGRQCRVNKEWKLHGSD